MKRSREAAQVIIHITLKFSEAEDWRSLVYNCIQEFSHIQMVMIPSQADGIGEEAAPPLVAERPATRRNNGVKCPRCGSGDIRRSSRSGMIDWLWSAFSYAPFRCRSCNKRFFRPEVSLSLEPPAREYTDRQGQYLAFIYYYSKIHGIAPSEAELQRYFRLTPPAVHQMILNLEKQGLIARTPGAARSMRLLVSRAELPDLA